ncbi:hypothetical protein ZYGR_0A03300 [Zygosaccharomyces rouxii]|uniref:ZYRO0A07502p n=2 Tax=Zygosaccharomyces rouxii TaxID=4956 RepID=C5DQ00_ZYGRC|nr:uncharacterized protein ZYRO0A07502g [Zygosaccharomyces rouxii]KAH9198718.1 DnaJ domain-containing protein [Zygosaccharomyces rouxii]GAV46735.1 hypothetical protein ZYGR_0A03300 [Zygosaccharomyces rouxii]CAR25761.1 ZYRO0A07502p [Zygosaccharomyces rouxii]
METYTSEQEQIALEVLSKDKHQFYEILKVERTANDNEIKKSYRKLAIRLHPDKNPHPRASEAFKLINRAFEVLGDSEKRSLYDRLGRDPDDRSVPSAASSAFNGDTGFENMFFRRRREPSEDLFDILFNMRGGGGGGAFGGPFGGSPFGGSPFGGPFGGSPFGGSPFMDGGGSTFTFAGPDGFRVYTSGPRGAQTRQRQHQRQQFEAEQEQDLYQSIKVLLPLLILFLVPIIERFLFG